MTSTPKVSVITITRNHERFIEQCVRSVMEQKTDFIVEHIVANDCSTDRTADILEALAREFGARVTVLERDVNLGMQRNFSDAYHRSCGTYVALLEGDDYWTDSTKLQRQVAALEAQHDHSGCFHPVPYVNADGIPTGITQPPSLPDVVTYRDMCQTNWVQTCSLMFRRDALPTLPEWFNSLPLGDWPLCLLLTNWGPLGLIDRPMSHYRVHQGGIWTSKPEKVQLEKLLEMCRILLEQPEMDLQPLSGLLVNLSISLARVNEDQGDRTTAITLLADAFRLQMMFNPLGCLSDCIQQACDRLVDHGFFAERTELHATQTQLRATQAELHAMRTSRAWRCTAPLRRLAMWLSNLRIKLSCQ